MIDSTEVFFSQEMLEHPRSSSNDLLDRFAYKETLIYQRSNHDHVIYLTNGYASYVIQPSDDKDFDKNHWRIQKVDIVFTKYPLHKERWRTNYYDLLAWRLKALFELYPFLNDASVEWQLILQTAATNEPEAKKLYHGIVLHLEPLEQITETTEQEDTLPEREFTPIKNGGFLFREQRNPEMFRSRYTFEPIPGREPKRNMDPRDLKCPRWR